MSPVCHKSEGGNGLEKSWGWGAKEGYSFTKHSRKDTFHPSTRLVASGSRMGCWEVAVAVKERHPPWLLLSGPAPSSIPQRLCVCVCVCVFSSALPLSLSVCVPCLNL